MCPRIIGGTYRAWRTASSGERSQKHVGVRYQTGFREKDLAVRSRQQWPMVRFAGDSALRPVKPPEQQYLTEAHARATPQEKSNSWWQKVLHLPLCPTTAPHTKCGEQKLVAKCPAMSSLDALQDDVATYGKSRQSSAQGEKRGKQIFQRQRSFGRRPFVMVNHFRLWHTAGYALNIN